MRRPLVVGNWKMNLSGVEGVALVESFLRAIYLVDGVDVVICPSHVALQSLWISVRDTPLALGAQDVFWEHHGAFTGKVSACMLRQAGVTYCIVGHSETRGRFGKLDVPESTLSTFAESDETVNLKIRSLVYQGIAPILCVGETLAEREAGRTDEVVLGQLAGALHGIDPDEIRHLVVAYEPVWAIGTGKTCDAAEAQRVCALIRSGLDKVAPGFGNDIRVLYGGSVKGANSKELFRQPDIDGGLVGGASLNAKEFGEIVRCAA